jgi:F-type H+-transporting ATPase subunit a
VLQGDVLACRNATWSFLGLHNLCSTPLVATWLVMGIIGGLGVLAARRAQPGAPRGLQNLFELLIEFVGGFIGGPREVGPEHPARSRRLLFEYLATLFLFIVVCNLMDVVPPYLAPTNTLNTTLALALLTFLFTHVGGTLRHGARYGRSFLHTPGIGGWVLLPLTVIEELSKPLTLAFRLFGNVFAGELMLAVLQSLLPLQYGGFVIHVMWLLFEIFVALVQSLIFMLLSLAYVSQATAVPGEH